MSNSADKKVRFISNWFNNEKNNLDFSNQIRLVKIWTDICIADEEYEMAAALKEEKKKLIEKHIKEKQENRTWQEKTSILLKTTRRKFLRIFKN